MPTLTLVSLSDSFASLWPDLAAECGLELVIAPGIEALEHTRQSVGVVAAPGMEESLEEVLRQRPSGDIEIAAVGAVPDHRLAVAAMRGGSAEYFALPQDLDLLRSWLRERADRFRARREGSAFAAGETEKYRFEGMLGTSPVLRDALARAARVIPHPNVTVLITGQTGTGKELLARAIHYNGLRREAPFVDINCAAIPDTLLESELFGHEKGAFTNATSAKPGLFEVANGGTLFLDEIGHLSLPLQGKLLRALQERTIRRVGGTRTITMDVRILAATHVDLAAAVRRGEFRSDLYYRLNVLPIELPPLRARGDDVLLLARHFLAHFAREYGVREPVLTPSAQRALMAHGWAGNIRELRNVLERAVLLATGGHLEAKDLGLGEPSPATAPAGPLPFPSTLSTIIRTAVREMVTYCGGNKSEAARRLNISRTRLHRLLGDGSTEDLLDSGEMP